MREGVGNPSGVIGGTSRDLHSPSTSISESRVGDYTQEIALGIISENEDSKIVLSGGTQMARHF